MMTYFVIRTKLNITRPSLFRLASCFCNGAMFIMGSSPAFARTHHRHHGTHYARHSSYHPPSSYFLMDSDTGMILAQSNADLQLHPASLTKTMTLLLTFEALERGELGLNEPVPISAHAASMMPSKLDLPVGSTISVQNAIYAIVTKSANDIAVALAEKIGGSEGRFALMMNRRAQQLGMSRTRFLNASGLRRPAQDIATARSPHGPYDPLPDLDPPDRTYRYFAYPRLHVRRLRLSPSQPPDEYLLPALDGLKTSFIQQSGFSLISSASAATATG